MGIGKQARFWRGNQRLTFRPNVVQIRFRMGHEIAVILQDVNSEVRMAAQPPIQFLVFIKILRVNVPTLMPKLIRRNELNVDFDRWHDVNFTKNALNTNTQDN